MAKKESKSFGRAPWTSAKRILKDFVQIKASMTKALIVPGRILYFFEPSGSTEVLFNGVIIFSPWLKAGRWEWELPPWLGYPNRNSFVMNEDQDFTEARDTNRKIIDKAISTGTLYFKQSDPILKFTYQPLKNA